MPELEGVGSRGVQIFFRKLCIVAQQKLEEEATRTRLYANLKYLRKRVSKTHHSTLDLVEEDIAKFSLASPDETSITLPKEDVEALTQLVQQVGRRMDKIERSLRQSTTYQYLSTFSSLEDASRIQDLKEKIAFLEETARDKPLKKELGSLKKRLAKLEN